MNIEEENQKIIKAVLMQNNSNGERNSDQVHVDRDLEDRVRDHRNVFGITSSYAIMNSLKRTNQFCRTVRIASILVLVMLLNACSKDEAFPPSIKDNTVQLFIFAGESNAGGIASNLDASDEELSTQYRVKIWNNSFNCFESMKIGLNNQLGHYLDTSGVLSFTNYNNGQYSQTHAWELQLSNIIKERYQNKTIYILKTGQGGSRISQWDADGFYFKCFKNRFDSAFAALKKTGKKIQVFIFYSQGINDRIAGTAVDVWKARTINHLSNLRLVVGRKTPIVMCQHMSNLGNDIYNNAIKDICACDKTGLTTYVDAVGASLILGDENHYDYNGQKIMCNKLFNSIERYIR